MRNLQGLVLLAQVLTATTTCAKLLSSLCTTFVSLLYPLASIIDIDIEPGVPDTFSRYVDRFYAFNVVLGSLSSEIIN